MIGKANQPQASEAFDFEVRSMSACISSSTPTHNHWVPTHTVCTVASGDGCNSTEIPWDKFSFPTPPQPAPAIHGEHRQAVNNELMDKFGFPGSSGALGTFIYSCTL